MGVSIDYALYEGQASVRAQIQRTWMQYDLPDEQSRWVLRVSTKVASAAWTSRLKGEYDQGACRQGEAAQICADDIKRSIVNALGEAPLCRLRVRLYMKGRSAEPHMDTDIRIEPDVDMGSYGGGLDVGSMMAMIAQLHAANVGIMAHNSSALSGMQQLVAVQSQTIAQLGAMRSVSSASADSGSIGSLVSMVAMAALWPGLSSQLGLTQGENTPSFLNLMEMKNKIMSAATNQEAQSLGVVDAEYGDIPQLADYGDPEFSEMPAFEEGDLAVVDAPPEASQADSIIAAVEGDDELFAEVAAKIMSNQALLAKMSNFV